MQKTVLVVDDSSSLRAVVSQLLTEAGYHVSTASGAAEALACLDGKKIGLILCDLHMPEMDGLQLISKVKSIPAYKFTPVIMLSTEKSDEKKQQAYETGIKAWIIKPFHPKQLINAVSKMVKL
jgi:two-component system chemotaxis response regulator CheY